MHLRRALLLFAVVLFVSALVSLAAPRRRATQTQLPVAPPPPSEAVEKSISLSYPLHGKAPAMRIASGEHLQLQVETTEPGQATAFGMLQPAEPLTPARFDVLVPSAGRYRVTFQPTIGAEAPIGTFTVSAR
jgi:hypothetical protein